MDDIEAIISTMQPLNSKVRRNTISCHMRSNYIDISRYPKNGGGWKLFFHSADEYTFKVYLILYPNLNFIKDRDELIKRNDVVVFSERNFFNIVGIEYNHNSGNRLEDLKDLSIIINKNWEKIIQALSATNIENTYNALYMTTENNENEINQVLKEISDLAD